MYLVLSVIVHPMLIPPHTHTHAAKLPQCHLLSICIGAMPRLRQEALSQRLARTLALHFLRLCLCFGGRLSSAAVLAAALAQMIALNAK
jgi:hypothetical protein